MNHRVTEDTDALARVVGEVRPDWVFHLATHGAYSRQTDVVAMLETNVVGTANLVEACLRHGFEAFVNTGSSLEYGWKDHAPAEDEPLEPNSHYAVTKALATMYCRFTARKHGVRLPTLRLYSVYGPYEEPDRLMPTLIVHGMRGQLPPLVSPDIARDYVAVDDVCDAYLRAAAVAGPDPGAIYNVGIGVQTDLRQVVAIARQILPIADEPRWGSMPNRQWDTTVWVSDNRKIRYELGWCPRQSLEEGLRRMADWFHKRPDMLPMYECRRAA